MTFIMLPVDAVITQPFGENPTRNLPSNHPTILNYGNYQPYGHDGVDQGCWTGTPVRVPGRGRVAFSGHGEDMPYDVCIKYGFSTVQSAKWASGIIVILDHGNGVASYYAHLSRSDLDHLVGQWVEAGTVMGLSGNTGRSGGPHLHWSAIVMPVNYNDGLYSRRNPLDFVTSVNTIPIAPGNTGNPATTDVEDPEEDFMGGTIDASQAEDIAVRAAQLVVEALDNRVRINAVQAESIVQATVKRVGEQADGKRINLQQADDIARASARYSADEQAARLAPKKEEVK